jgi:hypothetical protein
VANGVGTTLAELASAVQRNEITIDTALVAAEAKGHNAQHSSLLLEKLDRIADALEGIDGVLIAHWFPEAANNG